MSYITGHREPLSAEATQAHALDGIRRSHVYVALVTRAFVTDAQALAQAAYAAALGKPFAVVRQRGVRLPVEFDGATIVAHEEVDFEGDADVWLDVAQRVAVQATAEAASAKHLGMR